ncbi:hypothetical protein BJ508DRAFT_326434 [Ascobolus immersus RN42]|uniref:Uncharacterized protein n=1 Tax=Ascobolus immersus RN42 TaxID=1160509 RepID=A0A3N4I5E0_ASCIM|nr:hypothetical protein BJ508DRAFT_326434 [Ascobolus immersus RN42]
MSPSIKRGFLYVGRRKEHPDFLPLTEQGLEELYEANPDPSLPFEQEYESTHIGLMIFEYGSGGLMSSVLDGEAPEGSSGQNVLTNAEHQHATDIGSRLARGLDVGTTLPNHTNGDGTQSIIPRPEHSDGPEQVLQAARRRDEVEKSLKRKRIEMNIIPSVITPQLYARFTVYCKNRMLFSFNWSPAFKCALIRDCFGIDLDHTLWKYAWDVVGSIRTSWQTKCLNAAHEVAKTWIVTPKGATWAKGLIGKARSFIDPTTGTEVPKLPSQADFDDECHTLEKARQILAVIEGGCDWSALKKKCGQPGHIGKALINRALSLIQIEANNCLKWCHIQTIPGDRNNRVVIVYSRPVGKNGKEAKNTRANYLIDHIKLVDFATRACIKCPIEVAARNQLKESGRPIPDSVPIKRLACLPPLPRYSNLPKQSKGSDKPMKVDLPNVIVTSVDPSDSDQEDLDGEYSAWTRNARSPSTPRGSPVPPPHGSGSG